MQNPRMHEHYPQIRSKEAGRREKEITRNDKPSQTALSDCVQLAADRLIRYAGHHGSLMSDRSQGNPLCYH